MEEEEGRREGRKEEEEIRKAWLRDIEQLRWLWLLMMAVLTVKIIFLMMTLLWLRRLYNDDASHFFGFFFFRACDRCEMYSMSRTGVGRHEEGVINSKEGCGGSNQVT